MTVVGSSPVHMAHAAVSDALMPTHPHGVGGAGRQVRMACASLIMLAVTATAKTSDGRPRHRIRPTAPGSVLAQRTR